MTPNGERNGFGIWYLFPQIIVGWFKDGSCYGNMIKVNSIDLSIIEQGWYNNRDGVLEESKEDQMYPMFEYQDLFQ